METEREPKKHAKNRSMPFASIDECCDFKSVTGYLDRLMTLRSLKLNEDSCDFEKIKEALVDKPFSKETFDYPYALAASLHLITKHFRYLSTSLSISIYRVP